MSTWSSWEQDKRAPTIGNCQVLYKMDSEAQDSVMPSVLFEVVCMPHSLSHLTGQSSSQDGVVGQRTTRHAWWSLLGSPHGASPSAGLCRRGVGALVGNDSRTKSGWVFFILGQVEFVSELPKTVTGKIRSDLRKKEFGQM